MGLGGEALLRRLGLLVTRGKHLRVMQRVGRWDRRLLSAPGTGVEVPFQILSPNGSQEAGGLLGRNTAPSWLLASLLTINPPSLSRPARGGKCGAHTHAKLQSIPICSYRSQMGSVQGAWVLGGDSGCLPEVLSASLPSSAVV